MGTNQLSSTLRQDVPDMILTIPIYIFIYLFSEVRLLSEDIEYSVNRIGQLVHSLNLAHETSCPKNARVPAQKEPWESEELTAQKKTKWYKYKDSV